MILSVSGKRKPNVQKVSCSSNFNCRYYGLLYPSTTNTKEKWKEKVYETETCNDVDDDVFNNQHVHGQLRSRGEHKNNSTG